MARVISDACISCGSCDTQYEIDADACIDCGACEAQCPVGAISEG